MLRVKFNTTNTLYNMDFSSIGDVVMLKGNKFPKVIDKGFMVYRLNGDFLGDYSDYTKTKKIEGGYAFSK